MNDPILGEADHVRDGVVIQTVNTSTVVQGNCTTTTYDPPLGPFSVGHDDKVVSRDWRAETNLRIW
jgi:hypothetical protein